MACALHIVHEVERLIFVPHITLANAALLPAGVWL